MFPQSLKTYYQSRTNNLEELVSSVHLLLRCSSDESKLKAIREILDRIEGKVEQNIRVGSTEPTWIAGTDTEEDAQE